MAQHTLWRLAYYSTFGEGQFAVMAPTPVWLKHLLNVIDLALKLEAYAN